MARRRYQQGCLLLRGKRRPVWILRWRDDVIEAGQLRRVHRSEVIGTKRDFPTEKLALREAEKRLADVNDPRYRARPAATFAEFATRWEAAVLSQHKPSTQATVRSHIRKYLRPYFGHLPVRDIQPEGVQAFLSGLKSSPKTVRNLTATLRMMWNSARAWRYVSHDAFDGVVLRKATKQRRFCFSVEEIQRVLQASGEPLRTFYWLAAETGMRAGELCGLRVDDVDLERRLVHVRQSVWRGTVQTPKTENAMRTFALSPQLSTRLADCLREWRPNEERLLFATRTGTPWDANLLVKRKLRPLLNSLGIVGGGLHAFRHGNGSLMDRLQVPMKVRQQRLGHSDPRLTMNVYTHVASEDDERIAEQIGQMLCPKRGILFPTVPKFPKSEGPAFPQALVV